MAEKASAAAAAVVGGEAGGGGKMTMVVGVDDSETSYYALEWALRHFFPPATRPQPQQQYRLVVVTAKPASAPAVGPAGPGRWPLPLFRRSSSRLHLTRGGHAQRRRRARAVRGRGSTQQERRPRRRQGQGALHAAAGGRRRVRGGGRRRAERALRGRREAPRRDARRRQPRLRRHQKGFSRERQRLLRPSRPLHRDDREEAQAAQQALSRSRSVLQIQINGPSSAAVVSGRHFLQACNVFLLLRLD